MGDMGDLFNAYRRERKAKKAANLRSSTEILEDLNVSFESKNFGTHLIVEGPHCKIDFWPSTGKFIARDGSAKGRGIKHLLRVLGIDPKVMGEREKE